jgi:xanthine dehydrogenase accessory factor
MSFDRGAIGSLIARHGRVARVVVAEVRGSAPRDPGAAMLVWADGQEGTIGGGALEWQATAAARETLVTGRPRLDRLSLGPALNQCCGGAVTLLTEVWDAAVLAQADGPVLARPLPDSDPRTPFAVERILARARDRGETVPTRIVHGWLIEPVAMPARLVWVWGAGHVGRAIVSTLAPLPGFRLTWIDTDRDRFPGAIPPGVDVAVGADPAVLAAHAPEAAEHLVLTYSHALDLAICHALLGRGFGALGLIGSATKWARFRSRLAALGHSAPSIARIVCPIGDPRLGKHPQAIAVGVAAALLSRRAAGLQASEARA